jgi:hypothetical protein
MDQTFKGGGSRVSESASRAVPGRRLITSENPRLLTPCEIDLLRQDLQMALNLLGQDEIDEPHALMRDQGHPPVDFEIVWHGDSSSGCVGCGDGKGYCDQKEHPNCQYVRRG